MQENNKNTVNLLDLFRYLFSNWYWFILCIALCLGIGYYRFAKTPYMYRSDATVIIKDPSNTRTTVRMDSYSGLINKVNMSNEILQLQSKQLMSEVVKTLGVDVQYITKDRLRDVELYTRTPIKMNIVRDVAEGSSFEVRIFFDGNGSATIAVDGATPVAVPWGDTLSIHDNMVYFTQTDSYPLAEGKELRITKSTIRGSAAWYLSRLRVTQTEEQGSILKLSLQDYSLTRANDILNTLVYKYNENAVREKNRIAVNTAEFINDRLEIIQEELGAVEDELAGFKRSKRIMNADETASRYLSESRGYNAEIVKIETRIKLAQYLKDYVLKNKDAFRTIPINTGLEDTYIETAINQYNSLAIQRERLIEASSPESPAVKKSESSLLTMGQNILSQIETLLSSLEVRKKDLTELENDSAGRFAAMPLTARRMLSIERQQKIKENLYIFLLNKREENALTQAMVDDNTRMIDTAEGSPAPIYPSRNKILLLALLLGLFLPAVILISIVFLDTKIRTRKDIEDGCQVPVLSSIPLFKARKKDDQTAYLSGTSKEFKEAMRMMVTNLDFLKESGLTNVVINTTSFNASAGKSFITSNTAACLADAGKKVLLIDLDLRKRTLSDRFGLKHRTTGISNYIHDTNLTFDDILHANVIEGVDFVPAGHIPPNPAELLGRERFDNLIAETKKRYDYILLDGVPVNVVADTLVIQRLVDINLFVIRSGSIDRRALPDL